MWHKSTGKIVYDPFRAGMKRKTEWWCILQVNKEITRYYRWWITRELHIHSLVQPAWDAHVSIIRGEKPDDSLMHLWKKYQNMVVEFEYKHDPYKAKRDDYWAVEVNCPILLDIRKELQRPTNWGLHLSIGKEKY
jgi:hypothetical protein